MSLVQVQLEEPNLKGPLNAGFLLSRIHHLHSHIFLTYIRVIYLPHLLKISGLGTDNRQFVYLTPT